MLDRSRALNVEYAAQSVLALLHQQLAGGGGGSARRYLAAMKTLTLTAENDRDYELLLLAQRLGLRYAETGPPLPAPTAGLPDISQLTPEEKRAILNRGGSGTSIPDPLAGQRAEREERPLPFRP